VNLAQRLQDLARPAGTTVLSDATVAALTSAPELEPLGEQSVKGRETPVLAFKLAITVTVETAGTGGATL